jgi:hypothetical protein
VKRQPSRRYLPPERQAAYPAHVPLNGNGKRAARIGFSGKGPPFLL